MRLNSSSIVCLPVHSSADTYLHRPIFFVHSFGEGNRGFFIVFFFVNIDSWGEHGGTAMAVGDGVFASPTLDVIRLRHRCFRTEWQRSGMECCRQTCQQCPLLLLLYVSSEEEVICPRVCYHLPEWGVCLCCCRRRRCEGDLKGGSLTPPHP
jgi:hypothetical protein